MIPTSGTAYFYTKLPEVRLCNHSFFYRVFGQDDSNISFCGLCWLHSFFEGEIPSRLHQFKVLAENGNPETAGQFWAHLEASLGLVPPKPGQSLHQFRLAREQYTKRPARSQFPATASLWKMMGFQPTLAKPLVRILIGQSETELCRELEMSRFYLQVTVAKGIRQAMRFMRS